MGTPSTNLPGVIRGEDIESATVYTGGINRPKGPQSVTRMAVTAHSDGSATAVFEDEQWLVRWTKHETARYELYMKMSEWLDIRKKIETFKPARDGISRGFAPTP